MRPKTFAPRARACSSRSSTSIAAPSPITKPSRSASNGRETPSRESAPMRLNAARQSPVSAASVPPATTTSASPRWIIRIASPIAWPPVAHALETLKPGPCAPRRRAIMPAAALGIIIGTNSGDTSRSPPSMKLRASFSSVIRPPTPVPTMTPRRAGSTPSGIAGLLGRLGRRRHRELREAVAATRLLGRHRAVGLEVGAGGDAVRDARRLGQQGLEERVGALADGGDGAAPGDDDGRGHAFTPAFSRESSCTRPTASPTVAIDFRRPSAIWMS